MANSLFITLEGGDGVGKPLVLNLLNNILSYGTKIAILN